MAAKKSEPKGKAPKSKYIQRGPNKGKLRKNLTTNRHKTAAPMNEEVEFWNNEGAMDIAVLQMERHGFPGAGADALGITRETIRRGRKKNPAFNDRMNEAYDKYKETMIDESYRRAVTGTLKPVFYKGVKVASVREYSDRLLELNLKRHDTAYRDHISVEQTGTVKHTGSGGLENFDLTKLSLDELETFQALMKKSERDNVAKTDAETDDEEEFNEDG